MATLSKMKRVNVHVYERGRNGSFKRISAFDYPDSPETRKTVRVLYCGGVHYGKRGRLHHRRAGGAFIESMKRFYATFLPCSYTCGREMSVACTGYTLSVESHLMDYSIYACYAVAPVPQTHCSYRRNRLSESNCWL